MQQVVDEDWIPDPEEIQDYAEYIGIDVANEKHLLWIAEEGLKAPLPANWIAAKTDDGDVYYQNTKTKESSWDHPCDTLYQEKVIEERKKPKSSGTIEKIQSQPQPQVQLQKQDIQISQPQKPVVAEIPPFNPVNVQRNRAPSPESKIGFYDAPEVDMDNIRNSTNTITSNLQMDFSNEILKITNAHADEIKIILKQQSQEISNLNKDHQQKIQQMENENMREIRQMRQKHDEELMSLKKDLNKEWIEVQQQVRSSQFKELDVPQQQNQELNQNQQQLASLKIQLTDSEKLIQERKRELGQIQLELEQIADRINYSQQQKQRSVQELEQITNDNIQIQKNMNLQSETKMGNLNKMQAGNDPMNIENQRLKKQLQELYDSYEKLKNQSKSNNSFNCDTKLQTLSQIDAFSQLANTIIYTLPDPFRTRVLYMKYVIILLSNGLGSLKQQIDLQIKSIEAKRQSFTAEQQLYQHSEDKQILQQLYKQRKTIDSESQLVNSKVNDFRKAQDFLKQHRSLLNAIIKFIATLSKGSQIIDLCTDFYQQCSTSSFSELFNFAVEGDSNWVFPPLQQIDQTSRIEPQLEYIRNQIGSLLSNEDKRLLLVISDGIIGQSQLKNLENQTIFGIISSFSEIGIFELEVKQNQNFILRRQIIPDTLVSIGLKQGVFQLPQNQQSNHLKLQDNKQDQQQNDIISQAVRQNDEWLNTFKKTMK